MYMYRIAAALAVLMLFAACHDDGVGMEYGAGIDPSISEQTQMEEITVNKKGPLSPDTYGETIKVDAGRGITRSIDFYEDFDKLVDSCSSTAEITEEDYEAVKTAIMAADLLNYEQPAYETCEQLPPGGGGVVIEFKSVGGDEVSFDTGPCILENKIEAIVTVMSGLADNYITDCAVYIPDDVDDDVDDDDADAATDTDNDCIPDDVEEANGTDPNNSDTDGDGLADGWVSLTGLGEDLNCNGAVDVDADGQIMETDPTKADSDGDGQSDYDEMTCGGTFALSNIFIANDANEQCDPGAVE